MDYDYRSLQRTILAALRDVQQAHDDLGQEGKELVDYPNQFGNRSTRLDVLAEELVIAGLRLWHASDARRNLRVYTEEHGTFTIGNEHRIKYSVWLDGLNGSTAYLNSTGAAHEPDYGTMVAVATGEDPTYSHVVLSFLQQHGSGEIMLRYGGEPTQIYSVRDGTYTPAVGSSADTLRNGVIYTDSREMVVATKVDALLRALGLHTRYTGSASNNTFNVLAGRTVLGDRGPRQALAFVGAFHEGNIAVPTMYHLAGGVRGGLYVARWATVGNWKIRSYAQDTDERFYVLAADPAVAAMVFPCI
jgi:fructose-1,6-bisphosphatase/inositol monophosphatase family enzyme